MRNTCFLMAALLAFQARGTLIGTDERETFASRTDRSARALGLVVSNKQCSGALVGRRLVLTAAHCLPLRDGRLDPNTRVTFLPNVVDGQTVTPSAPDAIDVKAGPWISGKSPRADDWAILVLSHMPVDGTGAAYEPLPMAGADVAGNDAVTLAGYSGDRFDGKTATIHRNCKVTHLYATRTLLHDCDATGGASGAPLLSIAADGTASIAGIHNGQATTQESVPEYKHAWANMGASNANFRSALADLKARYPD